MFLCDKDHKLTRTSEIGSKHGAKLRKRDSPTKTRGARIMTKNIVSGTRRGTRNTSESMTRVPSNSSPYGEWEIICRKGANLSMASIMKFAKLPQRRTERHRLTAILERGY